MPNANNGKQLLSREFDDQAAEKEMLLWEDEDWSRFLQDDMSMSMEETSRLSSNITFVVETETTETPETTSTAGRASSYTYDYLTYKTEHTSEPEPREAVAPEVDGLF
jgi:hypothetical protein